MRRYRQKSHRNKIAAIFLHSIVFVDKSHRNGIHLLIKPSQSPSKNCMRPTSSEILAITV